MAKAACGPLPTDRPRRHQTNSSGSLPTRWPGLDAEAWKALRIDAIEREARGRAALRPCFTGSDLDPHAIRAARENAQAAGVDDAISFAVRDIAEWRSLVDAYRAIRHGMLRTLGQMMAAGIITALLTYFYFKR